MSHLNSHIRARLARRGQSGFILVAGLIVWFALCGAVLIALMSMTLNAANISRRSSDEARWTRAADASMEAAVQQIRMDPTGRIGSGDGKCEPGIGHDGEEGLHYKDTLGTNVVVTADCETSTKVTLADDAPSTPSELDVVGPAYNSPPSLDDTIRWKADCADGSDTTCMAWGELLGGGLPAHRGDIDALAPTLIHTVDPATESDHGTLSLSTNVNVSGTALAILNELGSNKTNAISVAGSFRQSATGPFGSSSGATQCGILDAGSTYSRAGTQVSVSEGSAQKPSCAAAVDVTADGLAAPTPWSDRTPIATVGTCGGSSVIELQPGAYTASATRALNDLMGGTCPNSVIWFTPGNYWFDVDDGSNVAEERHSLVIDDATVRVIFGQPTGGNSTSAAATATFPEACDPGAAGVSITLSPRTSIRHKRGRVAVCDRSIVDSAGSPPAIWQTATADGGWSATADAGSSTVTGCVAESGRTGCWTSAVLRDFASDTSLPGAIGSSKMDSLQVTVSGTVAAATGTPTAADPSGTAGEGTTVALTLNGQSDPICRSEFLPDTGLRVGTTYQRALDLFSQQTYSVGSSPLCAELSSDLTREDLIGARLDVHIPSVTLSVSGVTLRAPWNANATGGSNVDGWSDAGNVADLDGATAGFDPATCSVGVCPARVRTIDVSALRNPTNPLVPTDGSLSQAGLVIIGRVTGTYAPLPADAPDTTVALTLADGQSCSASWPATPLSPSGVYLDLMNSSGNCDTTLTNASQLDGATARLAMYTPTVVGADAIGIDQISVATVSGGEYSGPIAPNLLTSDAHVGSDSSTSISIFGAVSTPKATLNVRWLGALATNDRGEVASLIGAQTVVAAIGSSVGPSGTAGVLCCGSTKPAERIVNLKAWVTAENGSRVLMGKGRVIISDARWSGSPVRVMDWQLGRQDDTPPPTTTTTSTTASTTTTTVASTTASTTTTSTTSTTTPTTTTTEASSPSPATWVMKKRRPEWSGRYCADVTVYNPTSSTIEWIVDIPAEGHIDDFWNGQWDRRSDQTIRVHGIAGQNQTIKAGKNTGFGFCIQPA